MQGLPLPLRIRSAITSSAPRPSLQHMQRLIQKLTDIRNTDPSTRQTSLALAVMAEDYPLAHWLIDMGHEEGEISRDTLGETCLHIASAKGNVDILTLYLSNYTFVLDWVNARGATPLHIAAMKGEVECARILIEAGADLDAPDLQGNTPIHYASSWGHLPVVKLLIDAGCVFGAKNNDDFTAADYAFTLQVQKGLEDHARAHFEQTKRQRLRKPSKAPIRSSPPNPAPSLPDTPEPGALSSNLGLGLGFASPLLQSKPAQGSPLLQPSPSLSTITTTPTLPLATPPILERSTSSQSLPPSALANPLSSFHPPPGIGINTRPGRERSESGASSFLSSNSAGSGPLPPPPPPLGAPPAFLSGDRSPNSSGRATPLAEEKPLPASPEPNRLRTRTSSLMGVAGAGGGSPVRAPRSEHSSFTTTPTLPPPSPSTGSSPTASFTSKPMSRDPSTASAPVAAMFASSKPMSRDPSTQSSTFMAPPPIPQHNVLRKEKERRGSESRLRTAFGFAPKKDKV